MLSIHYLLPPPPAPRDVGSCFEDPTTCTRCASRCFASPTSPPTSARAPHRAPVDTARGSWGSTCRWRRCHAPWNEFRRAVRAVCVCYFFVFRELDAPIGWMVEEESWLYTFIQLIAIYLVVLRRGKEKRGTDQLWFLL